MPALEPRIAAFKEKYKLESEDIWLLPGGKSHGIKHKALEGVAAVEGIEVEAIEILYLNLIEKVAAVRVTCKMGDRRVATTGEAAPSNNRNAYPLAMAEKRGIDRGILKLLVIHGDIYSEVDAPDDDNEGAGERAPAPEDAMEKTLLHSISFFCTDRAKAIAYQENNKGMIQNLRVATRERVLEHLRDIIRRADEKTARKAAAQ
jgi:hypothetical protein